MADMQRDLMKDYLDLIGIQPRKPSVGALCQIVRAHLMCIPFENISKLYYKKHLGLQNLPGLELFLDGIRESNFGGTCYANNYYLNQLLNALGYQARLCGADMSSPDVHLVSIVLIENLEYLVDVGYAAPFLIPLPRYLRSDFVIRLGQDCYVLKPQDQHGFPRLELLRTGRRIHGYIAKPFPKTIQDFEPAISASFRKEATFMNSVLLARFLPRSSTVIRNMAIFKSVGTDVHSRTLTGRDELVEAISAEFKIPNDISRDVLEGLGPLEEAGSS